MSRYKRSKGVLVLLITTIALTNILVTASASNRYQIEAGSQATASEDAYLYSGEPSVVHDGAALTVEYQSSPSPLDARVVLIKFTNVDMTNPIVQARLNVYATECGGFLPLTANTRVDIYSMTNDTWTEGSVTWDNFNSPVNTNRGAFLMSVDGGIVAAETYNYWTDTTNGNFAQFVHSQSISNGGDGVVSLWLEVGTTSDALASFMDTEDAGGFCGAASNHPPILQYADNAGPLAITLTSLTAETNNIGNWIGWLVLIVAFLLALVVFVWRRRIRQVEG